MMKPIFVAFLLLASLIFLPSSTLAARILAHNQRRHARTPTRVDARHHTIIKLRREKLIKPIVKVFSMH
ncbi:hypothetical protein AAHE18_04G227500 [Arachis hypogaea]